MYTLFISCINPISDMYNKNMINLIIPSDMLLVISFPNIPSKGLLANKGSIKNKVIATVREMTNINIMDNLLASSGSAPEAIDDE